MERRPPATVKTGVIIGVPSVGWQTTLFLKHLMTLTMPLNTTVSYKFLGTRLYGDQVRPVAEADNILVHEALRDGAQYLFSLEEDVIVPSMGLRQLMATMGRNPDATVVAGVVTSKTIPPEPMIYKEDGMGAYWGFQYGEVFEAASVHMGCTLIRLKDLAGLKTGTIEVMDYPSPGERTTIREFFRTSDVEDPDGRSRTSQDIFFSRLLRGQGKKILVDAGVNCGHWDSGRQILYGMPQGGPPRATKAEAVNLGCGLDWDFIDGIRPLRVDLHEMNKPDFRADLRALPASWAERFDIVFSSHVLEHFDRYEMPKVFAEMVRVCKPGGEIRLRLPSFDWALEEAVKAKGKLDGRIIDVIWGGRSVPAVGPYPEMYHKLGISRALMTELAGKYQLSGRTERVGYNETYRLFKPPLSPDVAGWLRDAEPTTFRRSFIPDCAEITTPKEESDAGEADSQEGGAAQGVPAEAGATPAAGGDSAGPRKSNRADKGKTGAS